MGMKLKSGADLCGFELSRFCVQNDVAIPDAPASGRKYFHTGTGMEGKYSLLGRERIYTGTSWRAAAYVDDLANLDLATNADYLALKERVDAFLDGEVDSNGVLDNLKEIQKFLDNYSSATDLTDILNTKLDKSGGTITGALQIRRGASQNYITFENADSTSQGYLGFNGNNNPIYIPSEANVIYSLLHSGNVGDYALKTDGSNRMTGGLKLASKTSGSSRFSNNSGLLLYRGGTTGWEEAGLPYDYCTVFSIDQDYTTLQIAWRRDGDIKKFCARTYSSEIWSDWKTIAFTEFTNAQELQWQDASGNAQNVLFLDGYNDLVLGKATSIAGYRTRIQGNSVELRYGAAQSTGLILNSSGNVTIGTQDLAGTAYRLYVDKHMRVNGNVIIGASNSHKGRLRVVGEQGASLVFDVSDSNGFSKFNVLNNGNVGIGTTDPRYKLDVNGAARISGDTTITKNLAVTKDIVANGTIACKGVAAAGSAPVGTVDKWAGSIAIGTKTQTYTHGLGTTDITVAIYEKNGSEWVQILTDIDIVNANTIRVTFGSSTTYEHRIVVMG